MSTCNHPAFKVSSVGPADRSVTKLTCKTKGCGHSHYRGCTILRRREVTTGITLSMTCAGVDRTNAKKEIREEMCAVPLFAAAESPNSLAGVCRGCAAGWEAPGNEFANAEEKARALAVRSAT